jgi:MFS superfamily sulfate permease-like transporter
MQLLPVAGACFVMIVAQSSITARAYAVRHHHPSEPNRDLLGLCAADAAAGLSGTFVVNGSPTQTAMVETSGGGSQLAHLTTAVTVGAVLLFLTGPLQYLPVCVLGAIVFGVAVHLVDVAGLRTLQKVSPREFYLALVTAAAVVFLGVEHGILLALVLSLLQHVRHSYRPNIAVTLHDPVDHWKMEPATPGKMIEPGLVLFWFGADLFYANAGFFEEQAHRLVNESPEPVRWLAVDGSAMTAIDFTAGTMLRNLQADFAKRQVTLAFFRVNPDLRRDLERLQLTDAIGHDLIFTSRHACLAAYQVASAKPGQGGSPTG